MSLIERRLFLASILAGLASRPLAAQQAAGGRGFARQPFSMPESIEGDESGFTSIFDGKTLDGWEGDSKYWRIENGIMTGEITAETVIKSNTFIIWRGGTLKDFELKVDFRITAQGNSGINYRSKVVPDEVTPTNKFAMRGYQCDLDGAKQLTGNNYEELGRQFLAVRGQVTHLTGGRPIVISSCGDNKDLAALINDDWNSVHLIIRDNTLIHMVNGRVMSIVIDDDTANRTMEGLIGVQVHMGPPMKVEYRDWRIKNY